MKLLRQLALIVGICYLGKILESVMHLPIPGNILGMIILLVCLLTGIIKMEMIEEISDFLLNHLAFFFIPAGVGLISCMGILKSCGIAIFLVCIITTIIIMVLTGKVVQFLMRR